jgi:hypothetical protein
MQLPDRAGLGELARQIGAKPGARIESLAQIERCMSRARGAAAA